MKNQFKQLSKKEQMNIYGGKMQCWDVQNPEDPQCPKGWVCINGICDRPLLPFE